MRNIYKVFAIIAIFATQQAFAHDGKSCMQVAKACSDAGFVKHESPTKGIWSNCMKPILLGKTVDNVKIDPAVVKACREHKMKEMQDMTDQFKQVK